MYNVWLARYLQKILDEVSFIVSLRSSTNIYISADIQCRYPRACYGYTSGYQQKSISLRGDLMPLAPVFKTTVPPSPPARESSCFCLLFLSQKILDEIGLDLKCFAATVRGEQ